MINMTTRRWSCDENWFENAKQWKIKQKIIVDTDTENNRNEKKILGHMAHQMLSYPKTF